MGQDEEVTRGAKDTKAGNTDTNVGMEVRSTAKEPREQGTNEEHVMWSHEGLRRSMHSEDNIEEQGEPSNGRCRMKRDSTPRCLGRWMVEPKAEHASHARGGNYGGTAGA